jgi:hypothetical protein
MSDFWQDRLISILVKSLSDPVDADPVQWIESNITLKGAGGEGLRGLDKVDFTTNFPEIIDIFQRLKNPNTRRLNLCFSAQSGKTFLIFMIVILMMRKGKNVFMALPTEDKLEKIKSRLRNILRANKKLLGFVEVRGIIAKGSLGLMNGGACHFGLLSSPATLAETPADIVIVDEYDEHAYSKGMRDHSALSQVYRRMAANSTGILIVSSTPKLTHDDIRGGILSMKKESLEFEKRMRCPNCKELHYYTIEDLKTDYKGEEPEIIEIEGLGYAVCPHCSAVLTDSDHYSMCADYEWSVPETCKRKSDAVVSYSKKAYHNRSMNWSKCLAEYIKIRSKDNQAELREFFNSVEADPMPSEKETVIEASIIKLTSNVKIGEAPDWATHYTLGADVGGQRVHAALVAHEREVKGREVRKQIIETFEFDYGGEIDTKSAKDKIVRFLLSVRDKEYLQVKPYRCFIDASYMPQSVVEICRESEGFATPIFGRHLKQGDTHRVAALDQRTYASVIKGFFKEVTLDHDTWQANFETALSRNLILPEDTAANVIKHIQNMQKVIKILPTGQEIQTYQAKSKRPVDFRDAIIYALAAEKIDTNRKYKRIVSIEGPAAVQVKKKVVFDEYGRRERRSRYDDI